MTWLRCFINISSLYIWMSFAYAVIKFPSFPSCFKTRISGKINNNQSQLFSIEQHYCLIGDYEVGRTVFSSGQYISGLIHDGTRNHSIRYNFTNCSYEQLPSVYNPFSFVEEHVPGIQTIFDAFYAFQNRSFIDTSEHSTENGSQKTIFIHKADSNSSFPYAITAVADNQLKQLDRVIISKSIENSSTDWIVIMRYGDLVEMTELSDPESITVPPHDVFCKSDKQVLVPEIGKFYYMEVRIMSEYYKKQESLSLITISEYVYDGLISVGYHASTDEHIHYTTIVHDYKSGAGVLVNRDMELCQRYQIKAADNATIADKKELFKTETLNQMHMFEKQYFVLFWQVLELLKDRTTKWQYRGSRMVDSTQCNVWSYPLRNSWIAEVAFSVYKIPLRQSSYSNKLQSVLVSVNLYRMEAPTDTLPAISFRISDYQIDSNPVEMKGLDNDNAMNLIVDDTESYCFIARPVSLYNWDAPSVSTELLYDTSTCFEGENSCVLQFKLNITFTTLHRIGLGNVKRAVVQSIAAATKVKPTQIHHVTVSPVPDSLSLVSLTVYHGIGNDILAIHLFKERIKTAIDDRMYITIANENSNLIQVAYSVKGSLVFDYNMVNTQHWSVSVAATISLCIGTMFIGIFIGVLSINCWKRRKSSGSEGPSSYYRRFKDEEIEEVEFNADSTNL